ncbi:hypothetical protein WJX74_009022 [Apatococcus lobatus]|uniref:Uncharacterized protein n=1 Tax=Apatococcus lobatus TaxID=904363 RepID=A0AAW1QP13_9CHLO
MTLTTSSGQRLSGLCSACSATLSQKLLLRVAGCLCLSLRFNIVRLAEAAPVTTGPLWVGVQMFSDLNMNGDEITWNATAPLYRGESSPIYNLTAPFAPRSLTYYALLDGLNGFDQYFGAILLKLYEQTDAKGSQKFVYFSPGAFSAKQHYFDTVLQPSGAGATFCSLAAAVVAKTWPIHGARGPLDAKHSQQRMHVWKYRSSLHSSQASGPCAPQYSSWSPQHE